MKMQKYVYHRIAAHVLCVYLQISHFLEMLRKLDEALPTHPELAYFNSMYPRLLTLWNVFNQVLYAIVALICDAAIAMYMNDVVPKSFRAFRHIYGLAVIVPLSAAVSAFWLFFLYDRNLVLPSHLDVIISPSCNFLWHAGVIIYALWETACLPSNVPKTTASLKTIAMIVSGYVITLLYTRYVDLGMWPYGVLKDTEGTIFWFLVVGAVSSMPFIGYHLQFRLKFRGEKTD